MKQVKVFEYLNQKVRTVLVDDEAYFVGKDVATILGYVKPENAIATHVDIEDKTTTLIQGTGSNYKSKAVIINESGLYSLIFGSKLDTAKQFKRWVTSEVLPEIRKNGLYVSEEATIEQKSYNYNMLDVTFSKIGAEFFAEEYQKCIEWHVQNKTRLEYERTSKTRRSDKKLSVADSKIKIMNVILKIAKEREHYYRSQYKFELKSLMSECVKTIELDIKSVKHNQTRGKLAQVKKKLA
ncbi:BRO-N domain-containing protein [Rummeliibacillus suwonensis]|uniref:BRO-N domain-containing protein n=1 Tax=Rummeliibacillus suwonensis TaxID=1306154 RepID=UPI0011B65191|nr:BRO family protein [Rummeliibacillus suwonensis]